MSRYYSPSWHRVAQLKPTLSQHVNIRRHRYRGKIWYIIDDRSTVRVHRFTPVAYQFISRLNGNNSVEDIWKELLQSLGDNAPGQEDVIQLLGQLHANDLLTNDVVPDTAELFSRYAKQNQSLWLSNIKNPLSIRIPLWNPDDFLKQTLPWFKPFFSSFGFLIWLTIVVSGLVVAGEHWDALTDNISDRLLATSNLFILWMAFPLVKALHELGHGYAVRINGGQVHEMGVMLLAMMLVPYVDASASAGFQNKWHRLLVGAAGMMVELFIAGLSLIVWSMLEPGMLRSWLYNVIIIAGISTVVFNGNPLLRYDGYYMLSDFLEIPNLGIRANRYWGYLVNHYLLRTRDAESPEVTAAERFWFVFYAPVSLVYRFFVMMGIALFLASEFFVIGVLMALWSCFSMLLLPLIKHLSYLLFSPQLNHNRVRAIGVSAGIVFCLSIFSLAVPMPLRTQTEGVLWLPEQAEVRATSAGFVEQVLLPVGSTVAPGDPLLIARDPVLYAEIAVYRARIEEIKARRNAEWIEDHVKAEITREELLREQANLARAEERAERLLIRSNAHGRFILSNEEVDLPGRFIRQGELIGFVVDGSLQLVRVVVTQEDIDLVRREVKDVAIRLASRIDDIIPATIVREVPAAKNELPSLALSTEGGGLHPLDPSETDEAKTLTSLFQYDLALSKPISGALKADLQAPYGARVHVRFNHQPEPLAFQVWRRIRQLFLSRLNV